MLLRFFHLYLGLSNQQLFFMLSILFLPSLFTGLITDDLFHHLIMSNNLELNSDSRFSLFGLFSFITLNEQHQQVLIKYGIINWWTGNDLSWNFWRPLT